MKYINSVQIYSIKQTQVIYLNQTSINLTCTCAGRKGIK